MVRYIEDVYKDEKSLAKAAQERFVHEMKQMVTNQQQHRLCVALCVRDLMNWHLKQQYSTSPGILSAKCIYRLRPRLHLQGMTCVEALRLARRNGTMTIDAFRSAQDRFRVSMHAMAIAPETANKSLISKLFRRYLSKLLSCRCKRPEVVTAIRVTHFYRIRSQRGLKVALHLCGPCLVVLPCPSKPQTQFWLPDRVSTSSTNAVDAFHCVVVYGYDAHGFRFYNSWGDQWASRGHSYLSFADFDRYCMEAWTIRGVNTVTAVPT